MKRRTLLPLAFLALGASPVWGQNAVPTTQPGLLTIFMEEVKLGMDADHAANEAGWPAAFAKAGAPETYLAMASMTGGTEVWFVSPYASYTKEAEAMARNEGDAALSAELARLWRADGQYLESARTVQLMARPDLSHGAFPDLSKARFWQITTFRVRPGHEAQFEAAAKLYGTIAGRVGANTSFRTYQVTAGMPNGTYMVFGSVDKYADWDQAMASDNAIGAAMTADERAVFQAFSLEGAMNTITNRFRLDAGMSYVDAATRAADPAFWGRN